jgi:hypothetical protein
MARLSNLCRAILLHTRKTVPENCFSPASSPLRISYRALACGIISARVVHVGSGSFASVWPGPGDYRSTPVNGHSQDKRACLKGANTGHWPPYKLAAKSSHRPGRPLSSWNPRSQNFRPAPATRSVTTLDTRTSLDWDWAITRAAVCTAMPPISRPLISISPVWRPARSGKPIWFEAAPSAKAHRTARPGPSNVARMPSPVFLIRIPRCFSTICLAR